MAPFKTFIAMIKGWHAIAVLAFTLIFMVVTADRAMPTAERLQDTLFVLVGVPFMVFATTFLFFAATSRRYGARQIFPSVLLVVSVFVAVGMTGSVLNLPDYPLAVAIPLGAILSLSASGLFVLMRPLCGKIGW